MGGIFEDNLLNDQVRGAIHKFALEARRILMDETRDLLEGVYGVHNTGVFEPPQNLPALSNPENRAIYERLVHFLEEEIQAGLERPEAVEKLRKEIAFTHLNRLVAFKMMERRKLIREAVGRGTKSNGFLFYLADHPEDEALWQGGQAERAYQYFLSWQAGQIAKEIKVLFDPQSLTSKLFPRGQAVDAILNMINAPEIALAWEADETIGWIYQFFNEQEKADVFDRLYKKKKKMRREDIPAATQLFTPRWIVRFLVENTLGKTWVEMHPDSALRDKLRYLVPDPNEAQEGAAAIRCKPINEITLLDPACGTMHFGVLAFDLFAEMYREELKRAGEPGWPESASVAAEAEIPAAILANNLYGIDIDLRAVQLAALALYLKAKNLNKDAVITRHNLACADVLTLNSKHLGAFLKEAQFSRPIYERLIRALWEKLEDINQLGSLLRLEQEVESLITGERARYEREGRQVDMFVDRSDEFEAAAAKDEYWVILGEQIIQAIDHFAKAQAESGEDQSFFAGEAIKGMQMLNLMLRDYDVVVTNPPYMSSRNMNLLLSDFLKDQYPTGKGDLYAAFIERSTELCNSTGRVGMITQQSFMFISSYETFRTDLLKHFVVETMVHTGTRAFAEISGEKVNTTTFVIQQESNPTKRYNCTGTYFRLVHETDADAKQTAFEKMIAGLQSGEVVAGVYYLAQGRFDAIPGSPWVYWLDDNLRQLFGNLPSLSDIADSKVGINTGKNERFVRHHWEIPSSFRKSQWKPYVSGGPKRKYYGNLFYVLNWSEDEMLGYSGSALRAKEYHEREGLTYGLIGSQGTSVRLMPPGYYFSSGGNCIFPKNKHNLFSLLGILNSSFAVYLLKVINPTINLSVGDIAVLPIAIPKNENFKKLVKLCIYIEKYIDTLSVTTVDFNSPPTLNKNWSIYQTSLNSAIGKKINNEIYKIYELSPEVQQIIEAELTGQLAVNEGEISKNDSLSDVDSENQFTQTEIAIHWISYAVGIALSYFKPGTVGKLGRAIYHPDDFAVGSLPTLDEDEFKELMGPPEQFAYIDENGGWHIFSAKVEQALRHLTLPDGIAVLDEGHPRDLVALVEKALVLMLGETKAREVIQEATGDSSTASLRKFLERDFFTKWHTKWFKKRPVYWPIQSPNRSYGFVIFHEKITKDTFFEIQRKPYLETKINAVRYQLEEIEGQLSGALGAKRKSLEKQLDKSRKLLDELTEFAQTLERITLGSDGLPGYTPAENWIDDGVILRMASLWEVIPIWKSEPKKFWERLQNGDYDWSHIAMHYWPERCREQCKTNKSYAIAHGMEALYEGN